MSARSSRRSTSDRSTREVTTTSSSEREAGASAERSSEAAGLCASGSAAARSSSARCHSGPSAEMTCVSRAALLSSSTQRRPLRTCARRIEPAARTATSKDESGGEPVTARRVSVEQHRDLVARRVLELLHHQRAAARGRRPVDAPQRLSLLVVADAVEVEADGPPQQEPPAVLGAGAAVEEEPLELDEARVDDERLPVVERHPRFREPERVGDREADRLEAVASSRHVVEAVGALVAAAAVAAAARPPALRAARRARARRRSAAVPRARARARSGSDVVPLEQVVLRASCRQRRLTRGCRSVIRTQASARGTTMTSPAATG